MARVVVIGDLMTNAVAHAMLPLARGSDTPAAVTMHGGGSGANVAAWMAADGGDVAFVGRRGADIAGRNRDMELMGYGVDARLVMDPERPTGTCVVMVTHKGERTMLSDPGANAALSPDDLPHDLFIPGAHVHVSGYTLLSEGSRSAGLAAIEYSRRAGMTASVDAASSAPLDRAGAEPFLELSAGAVLLFVNAVQATVLTGREDPEAAARVLTAWYPHVVVKLGADGALFYANGRPPVRVPAPPVDRVIDGTGPATRSSPGSSRPGWTRSRRARRWPAAAAWPRTRSGSSAPVRSCDGLPGRAVFPRGPGRRGDRRQLGDRGGYGRGAVPGRGPGRAGGPGQRAAGRRGGRAAGRPAGRRPGSARTWPTGASSSGPLRKRTGRSGRRTFSSTARASTCGRRCRR